MVDENDSSQKLGDIILLDDDFLEIEDVPSLQPEDPHYMEGDFFYSLALRQLKSLAEDDPELDELVTAIQDFNNSFEEPPFQELPIEETDQPTSDGLNSVLARFKPYVDDNDSELGTGSSTAILLPESSLEEVAEQEYKAAARRNKWAKSIRNGLYMLGMPALAFVAAAKIGAGDLVEAKPWLLSAVITGTIGYGLSSVSKFSNFIRSQDIMSKKEKTRESILLGMQALGLVGIIAITAVANHEMNGYIAAMPPPNPEPAYHSCAVKDIRGEYTPIDMHEQTVILGNDTDGHSLTIYFENTSHRMSELDISDFSNFYSKHRGADAWIFEGCTDSIGTWKSNLTWANNRVNGIKGFLGKEVQPNVITITYSESESRKALKTGDEYARQIADAKGRSAVMRPQYFDSECGLSTPETQIITEGLRKFKVGNVDSGFLFDISDKYMLEEVDFISKHDYGDSPVYGHSSCSGVVGVDNFDESRYCGDVPFWVSVSQVLDREEEIDDLTLVVNKLDNEIDFTEAMQKARANNVRINVIGVAPMSRTQQSYVQEITEDTGGGFYVRNHPDRVKHKE